MAKPLPPPLSQGKPAKERLQKIIASAGITSRRKAEELILTGEVSVNGEVIRELGFKADAREDIIMVSGKLISLTEHKKVYFLFNKPRGCVCTTSDPQGRPTVMDYFQNVPERIYPVGRLDYSSEGLLIFTNDGEVAHRLMHPSSNITRTYAVKIEGCLSENNLEKLAAGIQLKEGWVKPLKVSRGKPLPNAEWIYLELTEGKNLEVRRLFALLGHEVERLRRIAIGPIGLADLPVGKYRILAKEEIGAILGQTEGEFAVRRRKKVKKRKIIPHASRRGL